MHNSLTQIKVLCALRANTAKIASRFLYPKSEERFEISKKTVEILLSTVF